MKKNSEKDGLIRWFPFFLSYISDHGWRGGTRWIIFAPYGSFASLPNAQHAVRKRNECTDNGGNLSFPLNGSRKSEVVSWSPLLLPGPRGRAKAPTRTTCTQKSRHVTYFYSLSICPISRLCCACSPRRHRPFSRTRCCRSVPSFFLR